jgi:hypothetical protein
MTLGRNLRSGSATVVVGIISVLHFSEFIFLSLVPARNGRWPKSDFPLTGALEQAWFLANDRHLDVWDSGHTRVWQCLDRAQWSLFHKTISYFLARNATTTTVKALSICIALTKQSHSSSIDESEKKKKEEQRNIWANIWKRDCEVGGGPQWLSQVGSRESTPKVANLWILCQEPVPRVLPDGQRPRGLCTHCVLLSLSSVLQPVISCVFIENSVIVGKASERFVNW